MKKKISFTDEKKKDSADDSDQIFIFQSHLMTHSGHRKIFSLTELNIFNFSPTAGNRCEEIIDYPSACLIFNTADTVVF